MFRAPPDIAIQCRPLRAQIRLAASRKARTHSVTSEHLALQVVVQCDSLRGRNHHQFLVKSAPTPMSDNAIRSVTSDPRASVTPIRSVHSHHCNTSTA